MLACTWSGVVVVELVDVMVVVLFNPCDQREEEGKLIEEEDPSGT
jgi:hypothetical protein